MVGAATVTLQDHEGLHGGEPVVGEPGGVVRRKGRRAIGIDAREAHHAAGGTDATVALGAVAAQCGYHSRHTRTLVAQLFRNL